MPVASDAENCLSRREFLTLGVSAAAAGFMPATEVPNTFVSSNSRTLIAIHLRGGNDGFNTIIPFRSQQYYSLRPTLAIEEKNVLKLDANFGLHPSLREVFKLYENGKVQIIPNVGMKNLTKSHVRATQIWETACADRVEQKSWMERAGKFQTKHFVVDGFDTHANQKAQHADSLDRLSELVSSLRSQRNKDSLILIYSEFGRTLEENSERGTDHGFAGPCLLIGDTVCGGIVEPNSEFVDYRSIVAELCRQWLHVDSIPVVGRGMERLELLV